MNQGALYSFKNCEMKTLMSNISVSAGMAWNSNENVFFYTDCLEYRVERYCYDRKRCELGAQKQLNNTVQDRNVCKIFL